MPKYNKKLVEEICDFIREDTYTVLEICTMVRISEAIFYKWQNDHLEFLEAIKTARKQAKEKFIKEAKNSLLKLIKGYEWEEVTTEFIQDKKNPKSKGLVKGQKRVKKFAGPNAGAVIFTLTNSDNDEWKNKLHNEHTGKDGGPIETETTFKSPTQAKEFLNKLDEEY